VEPPGRPGLLYSRIIAPCRHVGFVYNLIAEPRQVLVYPSEAVRDGVQVVSR
jgi:hypothetical protein